MHQGKIVALLLAELYPTMDNRYGTSLVGLCVDLALFLFPEDTGTFANAGKTAPEHPSTLTLMLFYDTGWILFLAHPPGYILLAVWATSHPGLVGPKDRSPLLRGPVLMLQCPVQPEDSVLFGNRGLFTCNATTEA